MNYRVYCSVLMLFSMATWSDASANEKVKIKPELRPGTRYVTVGLRQVDSRKMNKDPWTVAFALEHRTVFLETISKPDSDGMTTGTMTPIHVQSQRVLPDSPQYEFNYDSKVTPADSPLGKTFQPYQKSQYMVTYDKTGKVVGIVIRGNPWTKMARASSESMQWLVRREVELRGARKMTQLFNLHHPYIPKHAIKQGDSWGTGNRRFADTSYYGREVRMHFTVAEVTDDQAAFALAELKRVVGKDRKLRWEPIGLPGKMVFDRKTKNVTETSIRYGYGSYSMDRNKPDKKYVSTGYRLYRSVSDAPPALKPLPPITPMKKPPAAKTPTTKPAATPHEAPKKKAVAPAEK